MTKTHDKEVCDFCKETLPDDLAVKLTSEITLKTGECKTVSYCLPCGKLVMAEVMRLGIMNND